MNQYSDFAYVYDRLMEDVDYLGWVEYILKIFNREGISPKKLLELACGTGSITIPLSRKGYELTAVDISEDMLSVAANKASEAQEKIMFIQQDMRELELEGEDFDSVLCLCDGINYITEDEELRAVFDSIYGLLKQEGIFVFDVSSYYKLKNILGANTYGENFGDLCYLWENYFDEATNTVEMDLTFFIQEGALFRKIEEFHLQRAYLIEEIVEILKFAGFSSISTFDAFSFYKPNNKSERIFFVVKK